MHDDRNASAAASSQSQTDARLVAAVQAYMADVDAGRRPNRQEFVARHPDIADELSACLQGMAFVKSAAAEFDDENGANGNGADGHRGGDERLLGGQPLGDFKLVREIGRGGMGVVYEAVQLSLNRRVALKVLPLASALDPRHLQRFQNEAHAAAQLHHGHIVPVYAVGSERSVHFYAMQFIDGHSLAGVIAELREGGPVPAPALSPSPSPPAPASPAAAAAAAADSKESLSAYRTSRRSAYHRAVARLGLQAAEALEYAHQRGVVHRDIKPANLLLDPHGHLWVTDFGLAQMYADTGLTQPGDVLGTYRYMSPEQASGSTLLLDERTDIYSLGVTLYELLTLERAFTGDSREQLLHEIATRDPRPARSIDPTVPAELETILAKAMSKSPGDRYKSAGDLAADLRRFLADEPILARPPTLRDKAARWARRHKAVAVSAVAVLLLASVALAVSTVLIARAQARTKDALTLERQKRIEARQQRLRAEQSMREAHQVVTAFARFAFDEMPKDPRLYRLRTRMLDSALIYNRAFMHERRDDPAAAREVAEAETWTASLREELAAVHRLVSVETEFQLLQSPGVRDELKLSPEVSRLTRDLGRELLEPPPADGGDPAEMSEGERRDDLLKRSISVQERLVRLLDANQLERLRQLSRQARGLYAFTDPEIVDALALTADQKAAVGAIEGELIDALNQGRFKRMSPEDERRRADAALNAALRVLTETQLAKWKALTGAPPAKPLSAAGLRPRPGPGGPGGPGGGPRGDGPRDGRPPPPPYDGPDDGRPPPPPYDGGRGPRP